MPRYIGAYRGGVRPSAPTSVYRTCALSFPCHSEPVTDVTGVGIRSPFHINGGLGRHLLCRSAAKARFDNRQPPKGVSKEGGPQPSLFGRSRMGDFQGGRKIEGGRVTAPPPAGLIQIVANGHTAFTGGTRGRRAGTRSVRGPLAGRRAGRGHDRRPHGHPAACCADCRTPQRKAGYQQRARRRRHLPPQFNPCRRRREQGSVPRKRPRRRAPPSCGGDAGD